jgi:hypothetical protein
VSKTNFRGFKYSSPNDMTSSGDGGLGKTVVAGLLPKLH